MKKDQFTIWFSKNWKWIIGVIVGLIILYYIYKAIKKSGAKPHQASFGSDTVGDVISPQDQDKLKALAENIREDIYCVWCTRDTELYDDLSLLGNNHLVAINNMYNQMFELQDEETFYQALNNETFWGDTDGKVEAIKDRMRGLGIA